MGHPIFLANRLERSSGVGSTLLVCDQERPNVVDKYRVPALSTTATAEPFDRVATCVGYTVGPHRQAIFDRHYLSIRLDRAFAGWR